MEHDFLNAGEKGSKDAKFNMFKFQDHLLSWVYMSAEHLKERDYPGAFECLTIVYTDSRGFFSPDEINEIDKLYKAALRKNNDYIIYNAEYVYARRRIRNHIYQPPMDVYTAIINFRTKLMEFMTKHQLTIQQVKKSESGAGGA